MVWNCSANSAEKNSSRFIDTKGTAQKSVAMKNTLYIEKNTGSVIENPGMKRPGKNIENISEITTTR